METHTMLTATPTVIAVSLTSLQRRFIAHANEVYPNTALLSTSMVREVCTRAGMNLPQWLTNDRRYREARGLYRLPVVTDRTVPTVVAAKPEAPKPADAADAPVGVTVRVPRIDPTFVPYGVYGDVERIIGSRRFHSMWINGLQGMGKSFIVEQACAKHGREYIFEQFSAETSEDDMIGGFRLIGGETVWVDGPIVVAMKRGAVLCLDEADRATHRILGVQRALEGEPLYIKKTNTWVYPAEGFTVFATANTKGQGDETGKFVGTNVLNSAFLDRFYETVTHEYPPEAVEVEILNRVAAAYSLTNHTTFVTALVRWANQTRRNFEIGTCTEVISTRRLTQAIRCYAMYGDRIKSVTRILGRFDEATRIDLTAAYRLFDAEVNDEARKAAALADSLAHPPSEAQVAPDAAVAPVATPVPPVAPVKPKRTRKPKAAPTTAPTAAPMPSIPATLVPVPTAPVPPVCPF
jgi:MoxR-like ATPase